VLSSNTPNGSWGIVQGQPTQDAAVLSSNTPTAVGGLFKSCLHRGAPEIPVLPSLPSRREGREITKTEGAGRRLIG
jgi:hypothetical protein